MTKRYYPLFLFHLFTFFFFIVCSCTHHQQQEATPPPADSIVNDTASLRIAVMPAMSCLPAYYAEWSGLADSIGLDIQLLRFQAQMDIDTAILFGHADIAFTDLIRIQRLSKDVALRPIASCEEPLSLISLGTKRVKNINQMKEQMIAVSRLSATDYWCDRLLDSTRTSHDDIYRPQVNDVRLRAEMLRQGLIDAAMMGEPFATWMTKLGNKRLYTSAGKRPWLYAWAACPSATEVQQRDFLNLMDTALVCLSDESQATLLRDILKQEYQLPPALADTLELPPLKRVSTIRQNDTAEAARWLDGKKTIRKNAPRH